MDAPDTCPVCRDGQEADKGHCDRCWGHGVVCPRDGYELTYHSGLEEWYSCICSWTYDL